MISVSFLPPIVSRYLCQVTKQVDYGKNFYLTATN